VVVRTDALTSIRIVHAIKAGRIDVGVIRSPSMADPALAITPLLSVPLDHIAVAADHRWARRRIVALDELDGERVLIVDASDSPVVHRSTVEWFRDRDIHPVWVPHSATQIERSLDQVAAGLGAEWLNRWQAASARARRDIRVLALREPLRHDEFVIATRSPASIVTLPFREALVEAARAEL
jgi:DNA-binding transcriptional LysR family regulator